MKLSQLKSEPQLVEVIIDDKQTVKKYGDTISFHTWDRQPMDVFVRLANIQEEDASSVIDIMKTLVLDDEGNPIIADKYTLPTDLLMKAFQKVTELLGK